MSAVALESDPQAQAQLERSRARRAALPERREFRAEAMAALCFVGACLLLALAFPWAPVEPATLAALVLLYALALRVELEVGPGYTVPTIVGLVPMLFMLPAPIVAPAVAAACGCNYLVNVAQGRRPLGRLFTVCGQAFHAVGPAAVFAVAGPDRAGAEDLPVLLAAFAAYVACDAISSFAVDCYGNREPISALMRPAAWVYAVDFALLPIGFSVAVTAAGRPWVLGLLLPPLGLLAVFGGERRRRLDQALELSRAYRGTAMLLGDVVESDDAYTGSHSRDVVELALSVGRRLGLGERELRNLEFGALLHDVGKIAVPNEIINKTGPLDDEEWAVMRRHTIDGQRMLEGVGGALAEVGHIVRCSHEHYDGSGYPDGIVGESIPIESRICTACDAFSAMTTDRSYRKALPLEVASAELRRHAGGQFDRRVVDALLAELATS